MTDCGEPGEDWQASLQQLDDLRAQRDAEQRYRGQRRREARGRYRAGRAHPDNMIPTGTDLGPALAKLGARCGACGTIATGQFTRHESGVVWEQNGDRVPLEHVYASNFMCRHHGSLEYHRDDLESDLDAAALRPNRTKILRLRRGAPKPPSSTSGL